MTSSNTINTIDALNAVIQDADEAIEANLGLITGLAESIEAEVEAAQMLADRLGVSTGKAARFLDLIDGQGFLVLPREAADSLHEEEPSLFDVRTW
jgi:hypothetical protein